LIYLVKYLKTPTMTCSTDCTEHCWFIKLTGLLLSYAIFDTQAANLMIHDFVSWMCSFDGFTSTFQDKLFKGYGMEIHNQIFYTTMCSCLLSLTGLILQNHLIPAVDFMFRHPDCFSDVVILSSVATASQFFISYTIRTFGALTFATIMTTRQLVSILLSCVWFVHPLSWMQWVGAAIVFGALYTKSFLRSKPQKTAVASPPHGSSPNPPNNS